MVIGFVVQVPVPERTAFVFELPSTFQEARFCLDCPATTDQTLLVVTWTVLPELYQQLLVPLQLPTPPTGDPLYARPDPPFTVRRYWVVYVVITVPVDVAVILPDAAVSRPETDEIPTCVPVPSARVWNA